LISHLTSLEAHFYLEVEAHFYLDFFYLVHTFISLCFYLVHFYHCDHRRMEVVNEDDQLKGTWKESFKDKVNPVTEAHRTWTGTRKHPDKGKPWYRQLEQIKIRSHIRMVACFHCNDLGTGKQTICKCANHLKTLCKEDLEAAANCLLHFSCKPRDQQQIIFMGWLKHTVDTSFRSMAKRHHWIFLPGADIPICINMLSRITGFGRRAIVTLKDNIKKGTYPVHGLTEKKGNRNKKTKSEITA
jgi:hypothetical protein